MTRKTLFRVILALKLFAVNQPVAARFALPRKFKGWLPLSAWNLVLIREALRIVSHSVVSSQLTLKGKRNDPRTIIGDTLTIRKPPRYFSHAR